MSGELGTTDADLRETIRATVEETVRFMDRLYFCPRCQHEHAYSECEQDECDCTINVQVGSAV